jgi:Plavaka transposase
MTHCHREMYHAQWSIILDDEFLEAYRHGVVWKCCDSIWRRFYPRIFTYSADYKEKYVLITLLKYQLKYVLEYL